MDYPPLLERLEALARLERWGDETTARREPAGELAISETEHRLGMSLPESYKCFLRCTNGYRGFGVPAQDLRPVETIDWFKVENQEWIDIWTETSGENPPVSDEAYFAYGKDQFTYNLRVEYLQHALQISDAVDGAVYLLNPKVKGAAGEWEAWHMANWLAGAARYCSFYELVEEEVLRWEAFDWSSQDERT